jgi:hypothetical protein
MNGTYFSREIPISDLKDVIGGVIPSPPSPHPFPSLPRQDRAWIDILLATLKEKLEKETLWLARVRHVD